MRRDILAEELLEAIMAVLRHRLDGPARHEIPPSTEDDAEPRQTEVPDTLRLAARAKAIHRDRSYRNVVFGARGDLFGEPAWDILLDLYAAYYMQLSVSVSSACIASGVPATTGLRHLVTLEREGLLRRHYDPFDRRRSYVTLSEEGLALMNEWFARVSPLDQEPLCAACR